MLSKGKAKVDIELEKPGGTPKKIVEKMEEGDAGAKVAQPEVEVKVEAEEMLAQR